MKASSTASARPSRRSRGSARREIGRRRLPGPRAGAGARGRPRARRRGCASGGGRRGRPNSSPWSAVTAITLRSVRPRASRARRSPPIQASMARTSVRWRSRSHAIPSRPNACRVGTSPPWITRAPITGPWVRAASEVQLEAEGVGVLLPELVGAVGREEVDVQEERPSPRARRASPRRPRGRSRARGSGSRERGRTPPRARGCRGSLPWRGRARRSARRGW